MQTFIDPLCQAAATRNATLGLPWSVWVSRNGRPFRLAASKATQDEAEQWKEELLDRRPLSTIAFEAVVFWEPCTTETTV